MAEGAVEKARLVATEYAPTKFSDRVAFVLLAYEADERLLLVRGPSVQVSEAVGRMIVVPGHASPGLEVLFYPRVNATLIKDGVLHHIRMGAFDRLQ